MLSPPGLTPTIDECGADPDDPRCPTIGDCAAGIGIRETAGYITSNTARFAPHVVQP
jgi:hypothetical protein